MSKDLIKVPLFLVEVGGQTVGPLHINHEVFHFTLESLLGLLQRGTLGIHSLDLLLSLLKTLGELLPVEWNQVIMSNIFYSERYLMIVKNTDVLLSFLQLLSALDSISLILGPPLRHLTVGLGHSSLEFCLSFLFLLKLLPQEVTVMAS